MITTFKPLKTLLAASVGALTLSLSCITHADWKLTFAHAHPVEDSQHLAAEHFAAQVKERTQGEVTVRIFPNGQLGDDAGMIAGVRGGSIDIELSGNPYFSGLVGELNVLDLPFLFEDAAQAYRVLDGEVGQDLLGFMGAKGIKGLAFWEIGFRNLTNSRHAVNSADDIKGLKLRTTPNPAHIAAFKTLGANPVPMPFAELFTALETGTVDGQENPVTLIRSANLDAVQKYLSLTAHAYTAAPLIMNKAKFDSLPAEYQLVVVEAAREAAQYQRNLNSERMATDLEYLKAQGMQVVAQPDRESMRAAVEASVRAGFVEKYGSELLDAVESAK
ncbi:TRAP-type C4-dicarboxylate transport system, periplasmic component [Marinobacterium lacunae]|uniref:TRAP-type C4-dicarboxylate transport system, periplasmic component n=1 Tax=Marinobacterium lacunae TaxID=1232683 RepID=A0A081FZK2_9GAMM|nr:TRAP transporter substrate-binding protein [Marinobacterium lacunae]KEA63957.1 TRAP-type C4-dicarboxylate transport system, periplasmic component [Marinobacterium lacunae]